MKCQYTELHRKQKQKRNAVKIQPWKGKQETVSRGREGLNFAFRRSVLVLNVDTVPAIQRL